LFGLLNALIGGVMIESFFLAKYRDRDPIDRGKARSYMYFCFLMILIAACIPIGYALLGCAPSLVSRGVVGAIGMTVFILSGLFALRTGKYGLAIGTFAIPAILAFAVIRLLNARVSPETAFSAYIFYQLFMILFVAVFGRRWHVVLTTVFSIASNLIIRLLIEADDPTILSVANTGAINGTCGMLATCVVSYQLITLMDSYTSRLRSEAEDSSRKVAELERVMGAVRDGLDVGDRLVGEAQSMERGLGDMGDKLVASRGGIAALSGDIGETKRANDEIVGATARLGKASESNKRISVDASSAVNEMTASIQSISSLSARSKASVESLASSVERGEEAAGLVSEAMGRLSSGADSLLQLVDIITSISQQTDLLAMNAAIEAAHAGDLGKGFAVVAEEIRRLAEQTGDNIKAVTEGLKAFLGDVGEASKAGDGIGSAFSDIGARVGETRAAFEEIIAGTSDLSAGTSEIDKVVTAVVESSSGMADSVRAVDSMVEGNNLAIDAVKRKAEAALADLASIASGFAGLQRRAQELKSLGESSGSCMSSLDAALRDLHGNG
jgi:methyl-accepting chemotaxis protein